MSASGRAGCWLLTRRMASAAGPLRCVRRRVVGNVTSTAATSTTCPALADSQRGLRTGCQPAQQQASASAASAGASSRSRPDDLLERVLAYAQQKNYLEAVRVYESGFQPTTDDFMGMACAGRRPHAARDLVLCLMRCYSSLGRMDDVRSVFAVALRDLPPRYVNTALFDFYLEVLTRRKNFSQEEVVYICRMLLSRGDLEYSPRTYLYLTELHVRMGKDPTGLWEEMRKQQQHAPSDTPLIPLTTMLQTLLTKVVSRSANAPFVIDVMRAALQYDRKSSQVLIDRSIIADMALGWIDNPDFAAEHVLWLFCELELRCVFERASFVQLIQKQHLAQLLLKCAKSASGVTATKVLAMMDRHAVSRSADILAVVVWCWAAADEVVRAVDVVELMARKGYLEVVDPFRRYVIDCVRYTMDRNFLMILADAIHSKEQLNTILEHLRRKKQAGHEVSVHSLDVLVLAAGKMGDVKCAVQLVDSYAPEFGVTARTNTYNCLLLACGASRGATLQRSVFDAMRRQGVAPNAFTYRVLIRQAVLADDIDEAMEYLRQVPLQQPTVRVEVEMILPILERAAHAGDLETVTRVSKFSLDCDIGIDSAVMTNVLQHLREAGQDVGILHDHLPLHEALRSRSKTARQRARHELVV